MRCKFKVLAGFLVIVIALVSLVSAWEFNGTVYDPSGGALNNSLVNVTIRNNQYQIISSDSTYSNASGWFSLNVSDNTTWMYQPVIQHFNSTTGAIEYVGQSLPAFDYMEMASGLSVDFYLKNAGTINITAISGNGTPKTFNYQIKDQELGYPIQESFNTYVSEAVIYVPRDRNYSIMIHPNESMPVSYDWNNFSSNSSYSIDSLSSYNVTTHTLHKQFNTSTNLAWVSGNFLNSSEGSMGFDEIIIAPFLMEPGNMVYLGQYATIVYNMSSWRGGNYSDTYVAASGTYNITIPGTAESSTFMLFATGRNGTNYYGGYRNVSLSYSDTTAVVNFTMYPLMSDNWGTSNGNISMNSASDWSEVNASSAQQGFNLVNASSNVTLSQISAHIETTVDYSSYGGLEMTFMMDIPQGGSGSFYLPLLNVTGIKEINVYSTAYAPRRIGTKTVSEILSNPNISMAAFNPGDIDGTDISSNLYVSLYKSNSTCDVPVPPSGCSVADSANMDNFNPLNAIIGGGDISFRMGLTSSGIEVHYAKVDLLASGPPDALFDDSATTSTSGGFSSAMRFGSNGPTIYDYVLVSIPYTQGSSSVAGLNESEDVDLSISLFYDENWNVIWNVTSDGANATNLAGNYSHYYEKSNKWQTLMSGDTCVTSVASFNSANPCYIDTTNNRIWVRLPHFSGTSASISGGVTNVSSSDDDDDDSSSSSSTTTVTGYWTTTYVADNSDFLNKTGYTRELNSKQRLRVVIGGVNHYVGVVSLTSSTATINVSSDPQQAVFSVGQEKKFDVTSDGWY
ncbi:MAG: hypothetical protein FK732_03435, partial [Asgard group archaeon]|nr:hypothetical protein [Asgard group archaeon]